MRKLIYILCCLASFSITLNLSYESIMQFIDEQLTFRLFTKLLACFGWGFITYQIVLQKYKWIQKLCK